MYFRLPFIVAFLVSYFILHIICYYYFCVQHYFSFYSFPCFFLLLLHNHFSLFLSYFFCSLVTTDQTTTNNSSFLQRERKKKYQIENRHQNKMQKERNELNLFLYITTLCSVLTPFDFNIIIYLFCFLSSSFVNYKQCFHHIAIHWQFFIALFPLRWQFVCSICCLKFNC